MRAHLHPVAWSLSEAHTVLWHASYYTLFAVAPWHALLPGFTPTHMAHTDTGAVHCRCCAPDVVLALTLARCACYAFDGHVAVVGRYDLVALACKGLHVSTNFSQGTYAEELTRMKGSSQVQTVIGPEKLPL